MSEETITIGTDRFDEMGISAELTRYVASRQYPKRYRKLYLWSQLLSVVPMAGIMALPLWGNHALVGMLQRARVAHLQGLYQYHQEMGPSALLLSFAGIFATAVAYCAIARGMKKDALEYVTFASVEMAANHGRSPWLSRAWYRWGYKKLGGLPVASQLIEIHGLTMAMCLKPLLGILLFTAPFIVLDVNNYSIADENGATFGPYFSLSRTKHRWEDAKAVEVGCWVFDKSGLSLTYEVHWPNGEKYNLLAGKPDARAIALADSVDHRLIESGVERRYARFTSGMHSGELKLDLACVQELEKRYSSQVLDKMRWLIHPDPEVDH